jgi:hypothetical protein
VAFLRKEDERIEDRKNLVISTWKGNNLNVSTGIFRYIVFVFERGTRTQNGSVPGRTRPSRPPRPRPAAISGPQVAVAAVIFAADTAATNR